jgi:predicted histidine transporter YuiF (NhaC family)
MEHIDLDWTALLGLMLALLTVWRASRAIASGGAYYDREVYGMTARTHRRARAIAVVTAVISFICMFRSPVPTMPFVAIETVAVILYLASFARGASEEE